MSTKSRANKPLNGMFKIGIAGVAVGAAIGTGYSIHHLNQPKAHILNEETFLRTVETIPKIVPTKSVSN